MYCLFCVVLCIVCVYMCTVLLPPGGYPIAVNKYMYVCMYVCMYVYIYIMSIHNERNSQIMFFQCSQHKQLYSFIVYCCRHFVHSLHVIMFLPVQILQNKEREVQFMPACSSTGFVITNSVERTCWETWGRGTNKRSDSHGTPRSVVLYLTLHPPCCTWRYTHQLFLWTSSVQSTHSHSSSPRHTFAVNLQYTHICC